MISQNLADMNPTARFSDRTRDYALHRPGYPREAIQHVLAGFDRSRVVVADVGAGTGISSRAVADLLSDDARVIAIEPNEPMRAAATPHMLVRWRDGRAEQTRLAHASVDIVLCAQAFHWFDPTTALAEFHRILRHDGRVALMWNDRDDTDEFTAEYGRLILIAAGNHPAAQRDGEPAAFLGSRLFQRKAEQRFAYAQSLTADGLVGRALSASYIPKDGAERDALVMALQDAHARFADETGTVALRYNTRVFIGARVA